MFDYSALDNLMRDRASSLRNYIGKDVQAEVYTDGIKTLVVTGKCVDVYADVSFFDAIVYVIESDGELLSSPEYYRRTWGE